MDLLLLLSGPIAVGKSAVSRALQQDFSFMPIRSGPYLHELAIEKGCGSDRVDLQVLGDQLDEDTNYRWVLSDVAIPTVMASPQVTRWLFDCVRKKHQIDHFRQHFGSAIFHVHLHASEGVLKSRYELRAKMEGRDKGTPYDEVVRHPNETASRSLMANADIALDTEHGSPTHVAAAILSAWGTRNA